MEKAELNSRCFAEKRKLNDVTVRRVRERDGSWKTSAGLRQEGGVKPLRERWEKGGMTSRSRGRVWGWSVNKEKVQEKWGKAMKAEQRCSRIHWHRNFWTKRMANFIFFSRKFNRFPVEHWGIAVHDERHVRSVATAAPIFTLACSSLWKSQMWLRIRIRSVIEGRTKTTVTPSPLTEHILL